MSVLLETSLGDIVLDLYHQEIPCASENFLKLCKLKRYNDGHFFEIERGFVARACDATLTEGLGDGIYALSNTKRPAQRETHRAVTHAVRGVLSMPGPAHGSQFFITLADGLDYLDRTHTAFGRVAEGMDVLLALAECDVNPKNRPYRVCHIRHTIVLHDPFTDSIGMPPAPPSPLPSQCPPLGYLASDEEAEVLDEAVVREREAAREARSRAEVLEIIGDLPDAEVKPPDNVLFVCKLNPVTEADDLEIIFSRFGECRADVICDPVTGKSLNYAFVEFENAEQCERAYYKMDKALVDDRRIRVDFSQSVSNLWNDSRKRKRGTEGKTATAVRNSHQ